MDMGLTDAGVLVAGASHGIGLAVAAAFAGEGARVTITGRDSAALDAARGDLECRYPGRVRAFQGDMRDEAAIRRALDDTAAAFGRLDAVVANVGSGSSVPGYAVPAERWQEALATNLLGGALLAGAALERLVAAKAGSVTFVTSIAGIESIEAPVAYSAAKAALTMAMKGYARQVGRHGVRVNAVAPGNVLFSGGSWDRKLKDNEDVVRAYIDAQVPLGRFGTPEEIAAAVVFLASRQARFITGATLVVDGGQTRSFP
jgi:3-oxoacyl-[acyl-carrier protein] reductase